MTHITTVDAHYLFPRFAAVYLLENQGEVAFVDNNTFHSVPYLLEALNNQRLKPAQVKYLFVTHVHLDHAGGTAELLRHCPNAQVVAHPRAARHLMDPSKLVASARAVYGEKQFEDLYGQIGPIDSARVVIAEEGSKFNLGDEPIQVIHTRGHANHHFCLVLERSNVVFTGDAFGLSYPDLQREGVFVFPSTSPTDFDFAAAVETIQRIRSLRPKCVYPTHFGRIDQVDQAAAMLVEALKVSEEIRQKLISGAMKKEAQGVVSELTKYYETVLEKSGFNFGVKEWKLMELDLKLNADGLIYASNR